MGCLDHESTWQKHVHSKSKSTLNGLCRILQRPAERQEWQPKQSGSIQPHDTDQPALPVHKHYFSPNHFYCVETICAPCGVVIAWTKFAILSPAPRIPVNFSELHWTPLEFQWKSTELPLEFNLSQ